MLDRSSGKTGQYDVPAHHDFWRASPDGFFYTLRGYNEDGRYDSHEPGTTFDITTPTWRLGEVLLQAHYVATAMGAGNANLLTKLTWTGLKGRSLVSVGNPRRTFFSGHYACHQNNYSVELSFPIGKISEALPEIVFDILRPLYALFDFWSLPKRLVEEELREMRKNTFG